ncbi:MAG TPA: GAF domain-containing protein, partial [bacterium]|nr:GAF domain-containing protein [bacterium]
MGETKHPRHKKYKRQALLTWKRNKDRALLKLITDVINTSLGRTEVKEWLVGSICQLMDAEASTLLLTEEDYVELVTKKVGVERPIWTCKVGPERENDLIEKSIQSHTPLLINDVSNDTKLETLNTIPDVEAVSILCVPLVFNDTALGALVVFNKRLGS